MGVMLLGVLRFLYNRCFADPKAVTLTCAPSQTHLNHVCAPKCAVVATLISPASEWRSSGEQLAEQPVACGCAACCEHVTSCHDESLHLLFHFFPGTAVMFYRFRNERGPTVLSSGVFDACADSAV